MHIAVLQEEILHLFANTKLSVFVDATIGAAGHSMRIIRAHKELGVLIGFDQDSQALQIAEQNLRNFAIKKTLIHSNFSNMAAILEERKIAQVDGILLDLGVSSMQLDFADRGFSFSNDGPLDMRMNQEQILTAKDIIHSWPENTLAKIFYEFGEERLSRKFARAICEARREMTIDTTAKLVSVLARVSSQKGKRHPATKVFQALRIAVNQELEVLETVLPRACNLLAPKGVLAVISFHSLEDRIVKHAFRSFCKKGGSFELLTKKPITASRQEKMINPRSRSAKLRAIMRKEQTEDDSYGFFS